MTLETSTKENSMHHKCEHSSARKSCKARFNNSWLQWTHGIRMWATVLLLCNCIAKSTTARLDEFDLNKNSVYEPDLITSTGPAVESYGDLIESEGGPRLEAIHRPLHRCKHPFHLTYCMHGGRCEWIPELSEPRCHCRNGWKGARCGSYQLGWDTDDTTGSPGQKWIIALVLSCFGGLGALVVGCVCWRRVKYLRKHRDVGEDTAILEHQRSEGTP